MHDRIVFKLIHPKDLVPDEIKRVIECLIILAKKGICTQQNYILKKEVISITVATHSVLITSIVKAKEE